MNWQEILFGDENYFFLAEIAIRSLIMFLFVFLGLRITGKRAVKQLSIFELLIIIALGSAAGDPMLYREVGVLNALVVFVVIFLLYWLLTKFIEHHKKIEALLEGKPFYVIRDGRASKESLTHKELAMDEFFSALRVSGVFQLGEVKAGVLETSGNMSLLFYPKEEIRPGLSVWPDYLSKKTDYVAQTDVYACTTCGNTQKVNAGEKTRCSHCLQNDEWVKAISESASQNEYF